MNNKQTIENNKYQKDCVCIWIVWFYCTYRLRLLLFRLCSYVMKILKQKLKL